MLVGFALAVSAAVAAGICFWTDAFASLMWLWVLPVSFLGTFLVMGLLAFLFLLLIGAMVRLDEPQEIPSPFYRTVASLYAGAILWILQARVHTRGLENIPKDGRFLLVCNHLHDLDPVTLLAYFKKSQLIFISKRENEERFAIGKVLHKFALPINRENDREALKTILTCVRMLNEDIGSVAVFPEGYCSPDGRFQSFRNGVFKIAQKSNVPIVVCTIQNTQHLYGNAMRLRPTHVHLHLLTVIPPEELKGVTTIQIGDRIHALMAADLGEENT